MTTDQDIAENNTILRGIVGSTALGASIREHDDLDEMGVCIEPPACVLGLERFEHWIFRTKPEGVRSGPGDLDLAIYGLRKYCRLAVQGNPSILLLLYLAPEHYRVVTPIGRALIDARGWFVSQEAGQRFLGYLRDQKAKLKGERSRNVSRPELIAVYGYDTKFAGHALRLGLQGVEYMTDHHLTLPMRDAPLIRDVRTGKYTLQQVLAMIEDVEERLAELVTSCTLVVNREGISVFMEEAYLAHWEGDRQRRSCDAGSPLLAT